MEKHKQPVWSNVKRLHRDSGAGGEGVEIEVVYLRQTCRSDIKCNVQ